MRVFVIVCMTSSISCTLSVSLFELPPRADQSGPPQGFGHGNASSSSTQVPNLPARRAMEAEEGEDKEAASKGSESELATEVIRIAATNNIDALHEDDDRFAEHHLRRATWKTLCELIEDLPFFLLASIICLSIWRAGCLFKRLSQASDNRSRRVVVLQVFCGLLGDIVITLPLFLVLCLPPFLFYRLPNVIVALASKWSVPLGSPPEIPQLLESVRVMKITIPDVGNPRIEITGIFKRIFPVASPEKAEGNTTDASLDDKKCLSRILPSECGASHRLRILGENFGRLSPVTWRH